MLAWTPFIDPLPGAWLHYWYLYLLPVALLISVIYKAIRMHELKGYVQAVAVMAVQIVLGMVGLAIGSFLLVEVFVRWWG